MDPAGCGGVPEVQGDELAPVYDEYQLGEPVVGAGPEHNPGELEEVEEYEVRTDCGSLLDKGRISREQMPDITNLKKEQCNPVDANKDMTRGEWSMVMQSVDCMVPVLLVRAIVWSIGGVHDREDQVDKKTENCSELVDGDIALGTFTVPCERISEDHFCVYLTETWIIQWI